MAQSVTQSLWSYKWELGFTAFGLLFAGSLYYYRIKSLKQTLEAVPPPPPLTPARSSTSSDEDLKTSEDLFFDKSAEITRIMNTLQLQGATSLTFQDIKSIYQGSLDIMKDEYFKFTKQIRKRRRLIRKINQSLYLSMVLDYYNKIRDLLERGRLELISYLEIPNEVYEESIFQIHQNEERDDLYRLDQMSEKMMKEKMLKKRGMSDKTAKEIMKEQLKFLKSQLYKRYYETLKRQKVNPNIILQVIHTIIEDFIYEKYGFEEEHLIYKRLDDRFSNLEEVKYLTDDLEREEEILMGEILGYTPVYQND